MKTASPMPRDKQAGLDNALRADTLSRTGSKIIAIIVLYSYNVYGPNIVMRALCELDDENAVTTGDDKWRLIRSW